MPKIGRNWLLPMLAVPMALAAGVAGANPWLEPSETVAQAWDDIPFLGPPQRRTNRQPRSPETARALETKRELQRELNRRHEASRAKVPTPAANVFPTPRPPSEPRTVTARVRNEGQELPREPQRTPPSLVPPVTEPLACAERLAKIARYEPLPSRASPNGCGGSDLVRLDSIVMPDRSSVALNPAPQIRCSMAEQVAEWVREDVGPAAADLGSPLSSITDNDAYDCRPRNGVKGAQISEHGRGNALDITAIRLRNGGVFNLTDQQVAQPFRDRIRTAACSRFMTVLGPGSDAYHASHVHLDMAERARNTRICQWNVRDAVTVARAEPQQPAVASAPPARTVAPLAAVPPAVASTPPVRSEPAPPAQPAPPPAVALAPPLRSESAPPADAPPAVASAPPVQSEPVPPADAPSAVASAPPVRSDPEVVAAAPAPSVAPPPPVQSASAPPAEAPPMRVAAAPPEPAPTSAAPVAERSSQTEASLPLPRRKPEALLTLAQANQSETQARIERASRGGRPRYDSRRHFEREMHRLMRSFF